LGFAPRCAFYRFRESFSDVAGYDIACHNSVPDEAIQLVRGWLANSLGKIMYGAGRIKGELREFESQLPVMAEEFAPHPDQVSFTDICYLMREWIRETRVGLRPDKA
jgi:hypothetical protein